MAYFYGNEEGGADAVLTDLENHYAEVLRRIHLPDSNVAAMSSECAAFAAHLLVRGKHLRDGGAEAVDWVARQALERTIQTIPTLEQSVIARVSQDFKNAGVSVSPVLIGAVAKQGIADLPMLFEERFGGIDGVLGRLNLPVIAKTAQANVIKEGFSQRQETLKLLRWELVFTDRGHYVLGDVVALAQVKGEKIFHPGITFNLETHCRLVIPVSPRTLLVGSTLPETDPWSSSPGEVNDASVELSRDFFVSNSCGEEEQRLREGLGARGSFLMETARDEILSSDGDASAHYATVDTSQLLPSKPTGLQRVVVAGRSISYPYTVEIPLDWQIHEVNSILMLAPAAKMDLYPEAIGVMAGPNSLSDPTAVADNIRRNQNGVKITSVIEVDGVAGVLTEFDQSDGGAHFSLLALMLPTSTGSVQFIGRSPRNIFAGLRAHYEQILLSVRRTSQD